MKIQPLPPLNSLVVFEAVARHLSFTAAAKELNVTQGAISRQIRLLENYLGDSLFERSTREVSLNAVGSRYYETVHLMLQGIAKGTEEIRRWQSGRQITVMTSSAMASLWLLPKVADFQRLHPDVDLRIVAFDRVKDYSRLDCDVALYYCRTPPLQMTVTPLFSEEVFPVCSGDYLEKNPHIRTIDQLDSATWLWLDDPQTDWIGWPEWFERLGYETQAPRHRVNINNYSMLIQSALTGQGIALAWSHLVGTHLETGDLVKPVKDVLQTNAKFCLLEHPGRDGNLYIVSKFREWLLQQIRPFNDKNS
ncbi:MULTISPECIES: LysR substrate-binding domain-containing protein [Pseudomonas]|jgi:DNA-binding transcriptional LysR family regulator|uniref:LysR family transcriptional regulator n=1 Tax=Pseudomonas lini TaxID=163011 RepID=A0A423IIS7_9PSED|nr:MULTISPECIES: LysR substrate-binding domain-containing protein [Pseudomonas]RON25345.1 LysR family transcriptional regulator [Pseudomonas lini]